MFRVRVINNGDKFKSDIMKMMTKATSNDVKIALEDGEIQANKDVLCARSEYFATMLSNEEVKFIEGETKTVDMGYCSKLIMEKIIKYLFSGDMTLHDLSLPNLVKMMNMTSMMMMDDIYENVNEYVLELIGETNLPLPDLVDSLVLVESFNLKTVKKEIVKELHSRLKDIPIQNVEAFKMLPINLVKDILLSLDEDGDEDEIEEEGQEDEEDDNDEEEEDDEDDYENDEDEDEDEDSDEDDEDWLGDTNDADRLNAFVFWLSRNKCSDEDKKEIIDSIDIEKSCFTAEKLLTDMRRSGLFSIEEIVKRVLDIIRFTRSHRNVPSICKKKL